MQLFQRGQYIRSAEGDDDFLSVVISCDEALRIDKRVTFELCPASSVSDNDIVK
jgi:hypothetical protein